METLKNIWQMWKRFGQFIGDFIARVFLTLFYFTIFVPFGMAVRLWGDPLRIRKNLSTKWLERNTRDLNIEGTRRLF
jgi:hypothetical protein